MKAGILHHLQLIGHRTPNPAHNPAGRAHKSAVQAVISVESTPLQHQLLKQTTAARKSLCSMYNPAPVLAELHAATH